MVRSVTIIAFFLFLHTVGCQSADIAGYEVTKNILNSWLRICDPTHPFDYLTPYASKIVERRGNTKIIPFLIAHILLSRGKGEHPLYAPEKIKLVEQMMDMWYSPVSAALHDDNEPGKEMLSKMREVLMQKFGPLLGLIPISEKERKQVEELMVKLEKERLIPNGVGGDEIWIGDYFVTGFIAVHPSVVERTVFERKIDSNKPLHPLILLDGDALPFLFDTIKRKIDRGKDPVKEMLIANAIMLRWGVIEHAILLIISGEAVEKRLPPPAWLLEYEKRWFLELINAFRFVKNQIHSGQLIQDK